LINTKTKTPGLKSRGLIQFAVGTAGSRLSWNSMLGILTFPIVHFHNMISTFRDWFWQVGIRPSGW
jgi:hypothetical protein